MLTKNTTELRARVQQHVTADQVVQRIAETIFEALPASEAKAFFAALPDAVCDGKDLSRVGWQFLAAELRALPTTSEEIQAVIDPVIAGMELLAAGQEWPAAEAADRAQRQPVPPVPGEVAELVRVLHQAADNDEWDGVADWCAVLTRAAELLSQRHPQPVPVSERPWEREGWCDEQGRCWWGRSADECCNPDWHYATRAEVEEFCSEAMPQVSLPAHALPLPGEVES